MEKTITIFSEIGDSFWGGTSKEAIWEALDSQGVDTLNVIISSPGGDAFEGLAMHDFLKGFKGVVNTYATGVVASAATFPLLAGDKVYMTPQSALMIHNASTVAWGDAEKLNKAAEVTSKVDKIINAIYAKKSGQHKDKVKEWMTAETWFTPEEALQAGLIDGIKPLPKGIKVVNSLNTNFQIPARIQDKLNSTPMFEELTDFLKKHFIAKADTNAEEIMNELTEVLNKTPEVLNVQKINDSLDGLALKITNLAENLEETRLVLQTNKMTIDTLAEKIRLLESQNSAMEDVISNISTGVPVPFDTKKLPVADSFVKNQLNLK